MDNQTEKKQLAGVIGYFTDPNELIVATRKVREARYASFDAFTPYPVHGMDEAQGLERSPLPFITFAAGITGCTLGFSLQYWTSAVDWALNVGGKPFNSWPAFVPVMFECTILFAGLATVAGMFILNRLPNLKYRAFDPRITQDRFALLIEPKAEPSRFRLNLFSRTEEADLTIREGRHVDKKFDEAEAQEFLRSLGAQEVKSVYLEGWF